MEKYKVIWPHYGDKPYNVGDIREAHPARVKHLVKNGTLELIPREAKKSKPKDKGEPVKKADEKPTSNKAETSATISNKSMPSSPDNKKTPGKSFHDRRKLKG